MAIRDSRRDKLNSYVMLSGQYGHDQTSESYDYNQALLDEQFEQLGNVYTIEEEKVRGSGIYEDLRASIGTVRTIESKTNIVDNIRNLIFSRVDYDNWVGKRYKFGDNIWITVNTTSINTLFRNSLVQRCNNVLKWYDYNNDIIYEEPCVVGEKLTSTTPSQKNHIIIAENSLSVILQYNDISKNIKISDRFILNGSAYSVKTVESLKRFKTLDKDSIGNITLELEFSEINLHTDDLENNVAYKNDRPASDKLNGNVVTPDVHELTMFKPYNLGTWEVYNYVNDIRQDDIFEFEFFDAPSNTYKIIQITTNSFTVECLKYSTNVPLSVQYRNKLTNEIGEFEIELRGVL